MSAKPGGLILRRHYRVWALWATAAIVVAGVLVLYATLDWLAGP